ncbi:hypothetical protein [Vibrio brasiliensis]|uniref:hypothetical protein n=1 Tax=Vibrio brasiliensis TaxID=170652 RepID=UPI001EFE08EE|nr:hypothetical protein [Vibrio brasiliensis]MCG9725704.1 hypothetical protein [Vibrio brasiliensis]
MKNVKIGLLLTVIIALSFKVSAEDYLVTLKWKTDDAQKIFELFPMQKQAFSNLSDTGLIKEVFISKTKVGKHDFPIITFSMEGVSKAEIREALSKLPFQYNDVVDIDTITSIGEKWLDFSPAFESYYVEFEWFHDGDVLVSDQVLSNDLQNVVDLNSKGIITSAYLKPDRIGGVNTIRPLYSLTVLAKNEYHAREIIQKLESVEQGKATFKVSKLGFKMEI